MKKRYVKSLHKQNFEEKMLVEFSYLFNDVVLRLDEQN